MSDMDANLDHGLSAMTVVDEFSLELARNRAASFDVLSYKGRKVADVEARVIEAQFRLLDGNTLLLLSDDEPYRERLTIILVGPGLLVLDRVLLGGAFTPGFLAYAAPRGPDEVAFCWHDLEQVVTIRRRKRWFGLKSPRWLSVRDLESQRPPSAHAPAPKR